MAPPGGLSLLFMDERQIGELGALFAGGFAIIAVGDGRRVAIAPDLGGTLVGMILIGCGAGLINAQLSGAFSAFALPEWAGTASALGITMRQLGYALGIALLGAAAGMGAIPFAGAFITAAAAAGVGSSVALDLRRREPARKADEPASRGE